MKILSTTSTIIPYKSKIYQPKIIRLNSFKQFDELIAFKESDGYNICFFKGVSNSSYMLEFEVAFGKDEDIKTEEKIEEEIL
jgi:hypothetical protein